ncbi:hypothetical protein K491DRAFT_603334 [Lophiostoma macrostomum CBS 122681]|uniref:Life-span regulatory factor-domain-containing protein n=1 Tax=Lophiostoma macrostomum CBS 122681 TaxID=1314788 RepID=A0A6A6T263_9PLEO|nr:hypothetical protein K491DRAFT_603334 [Lophiostoma macrostomum CBS 122681]
MATLHNTRLANHSKRPLPAHARPSKPASLSKRTHSRGGSKNSAHHRAASLEDEQDEEVMATSFLQFCTTCEKQIVVPSNFVLYCSESCRKKDNEKQLSFPVDHYSPPPTPFSNFSFEDLHFRDIVPPRSPTAPRSQRSSCAFSFSEQSSDDNATSSDEKLLQDSEASRYLRQFQTTASTASETARPARPRYTRTSTPNATYNHSSQSQSHIQTQSAAPSLSHTPASSFSFSLPYTPSTRPLPPRTNPHSTSYGSRSIDLVTPFGYATAPSTPPSQQQYTMKAGPLHAQTNKGNAEGEILYAKSPIPSVGSANGSLKQLFAGTPKWA